MSLATAAFVAGVATTSGVLAQTAPQIPQASPSATVETLARDGYEIKAIQNAASRGLGYVVMMQRGPEVRTCLMRITKGADSRPAKQSVCF